MRDLLLAVMDVSTVFPVVLRVNRNSVASFDESELDWKQLQYIWSEHDDLNACKAVVVPRSAERLNGTALVVLRASLGDVPCERASHVALAVRGERLIVDTVGGG